MKKFMWLISLFSILILTGCDSSSDEGKELQQRILKVMGIPHNIVVNICQDDNDNSICDNGELNAKITINKNDNLNKILEKIRLNTDGTYLLKHHDPSKNIIMDLQDPVNLRYNNGRLSLFYNPLSQELSILQALVDSGYLTQTEIKSIQNMKNRAVLDKVILESLFYNQNILMDNGLSVNIAMSSNLKYMANELRKLDIENTLPFNINECNGNQLCIDTILNPVKLRLKIDELEIKKIVQNKSIEPYSTKGLTGSGSGAFKDGVVPDNSTFIPVTTPTPTVTVTPTITPTPTVTVTPTITPTPTKEPEPTVTTPPTPTPSSSKKNAADGYIVKLSSRATAVCDDGKIHYSEYSIGKRGKLTFNIGLTDECIITIHKGATIDSNNNGYNDEKDILLPFNMKSFASAQFITPLTTLLVAKKERGEALPNFKTVVKDFDPVEVANIVPNQSGTKKLESQKLMILMEILRTVMPNEHISLADIDISSMTIKNGDTIESFDIESIITSLPSSLQKEAGKRANIMKQLSILLDDLDSNKINLATFMTNISDRRVNINAAIRHSKSSRMTFAVTDSFRKIIDSSSDLTKVETQLERLNVLLNNSPIAHAGSDQTVIEGKTIFLNGSLSSDIDEDIVKYEWRDEKGVIGNHKIFAKSDFYVGTHKITLKVTDDVGVTHSDEVIIVVNAKTVTEPEPTLAPTPTLIPPARLNSTLKKTGQSVSYEQFDDGYFKIGKNHLYSRDNEIVTDKITNLSWQDNKDVGAVKKSWEDAKSYCLALSLGDYKNWRLPTINELGTILLYGKYNPTLDSIFNPTTTDYWTSTEYESYDDYIWLINFYYGTSTMSNKTYENSVRCVREIN